MWTDFILKIKLRSQKLLRFFLMKKCSTTLHSRFARVVKHGFCGYALAELHPSHCRLINEMFGNDFAKSLRYIQFWLFYYCVVKFLNVNTTIGSWRSKSADFALLRKTLSHTAYGKVFYTPPAPVVLTKILDSTSCSHNQSEENNQNSSPALRDVALWLGHLVTNITGIRTSLRCTPLRPAGEIV